MRIAKLYRYPIKSMGGEELQSARVFRNGIAGDRRYGIVDLTTGKIASAKSPKKWGVLLRFSARYVSEPAEAEPLPPIDIKFPDGRVRRSDSSDIDGQLSKAIGRDVRLISITPPRASSEVLWRVVKEQEATEWTRQRTVGVEGGQDIVVFELAEAVPRVDGEDTFHDFAPIHLITTSTLRRLEKLRPGVKFDHRRYRPNILLESPNLGFVEQEWDGKSVWFGQVGMYVLVPTPRCVMSTLSHEGLPEDRRTLRSIAKHNTLELRQLPGRWACAGIYVSPFIDGRIHVGCPMSVAESTLEVVTRMRAATAELQDQMLSDLPLAEAGSRERS